MIIYKKAEKYKQRLINEENVKLRLSMDVKNQELVSKAMNMFKINQIVMDVGNQLKLILPGLSKEKTDSLQQLLKNLESSLPTEAWKEFETRFEQVHKGFYDILVNRYPDLSPTELKVCGFLRLNLTTKDIALLTNRSIGTIDHSRSSIRKKLNLENDANLTTYLLSI
jgi:DNA-binding NarL/FixJ family response regulator